MHHLQTRCLEENRGIKHDDIEARELLEKRDEYGKDHGWMQDFDQEVINRIQ
jgi:hypothetical protein